MIRDVGHHLVGRDPDSQVVRADHQEQSLGMPRKDRVQPAEHPPGLIAADAAVADMAVVEQFGPFAAVGDAVAQEDDVARTDRQHLEEAAPLVVIFALRQDAACAQQQQSQKQKSFHGLSGEGQSSRR